MNKPIDIHLEWGAQPVFEVQHTDTAVVVRADARLSDAQVRAACQELDAHGDAVYQAWRERVGLG